MNSLLSLHTLELRTMPATYQRTRLVKSLHCCFMIAVKMTNKVSEIVAIKLEVVGYTDKMNNILTILWLTEKYSSI